jgi:TRAP-type transport system small permease protein
MDQIRRVIDKAVDVSAMALLVSMVIVVFAQVFFRYVVKSAPAWTEEFARYNFVWLVFLGAVAVFRRKAHIVVDTIIMLLPARVVRILNLPVQTLIFVLLLFFVFYGTALCRHAWTTRAASMEFPLTFVYLAFPVSAFLMLFYQLTWVFDLMKGRRSST